MAACSATAAVRCSVNIFVRDTVFTSTNICRLSSSYRGKGYTSWRTCSSSTSSCSSESSAADVVEHYDRLVHCGSLREDAQQRYILQQLTRLQHILNMYSNSKYLSPPPPKPHTEDDNSKPQRDEEARDTTARNGGGELVAEVTEDESNPRPPKGFYIYGDVGTGKTMLMDLFYSYVGNTRKKRVHFNGFMLDIHQRIHRRKQSLPKRTLGKMFTYDPISPVAMEIGNETCLLCFDEFQGYCHTVSLNGGIDYRRLDKATSGKLYYLAEEPGAEVFLDELFKELASTQKSVTGPRMLSVLGRDVTLNKTCGSIADCTFDELCGQHPVLRRNHCVMCCRCCCCCTSDISLVVLKPLGASDYLEIARLFDTVFIRHVPVLTLTLKDQARRFTTLIDNFYDKKVRVVLLAAAPLHRLFVHSGGEDEKDRQLLDDLGLSGEAAQRLTLFTAEEEIFAFQRTVSRLTEMQTEPYWKAGDRRHGSEHT
ncbi:lactation elevated protein 1 homolog B isoform X3 [Solea solea]|uniref:lactation elevated protein 1 homolog B isoform X3 n=1 Tax=Solea solea TaxID=90069 RepID=UPI002729E297|nr:lactation elevated protein 1 homolog B isoform X3 [Solea solea]